MIGHKLNGQNMNGINENHKMNIMQIKVNKKKKTMRNLFILLN